MTSYFRVGRGGGVRNAPQNWTSQGKKTLDMVGRSKVVENLRTSSMDVPLYNSNIVKAIRFYWRKFDGSIASGVNATSGF